MIVRAVGSVERRPLSGFDNELSQPGPPLQCSVGQRLHQLPVSSRSSLSISNLEPAAKTFVNLHHLIVRLTRSFIHPRVEPSTVDTAFRHQCA